MSNPTPPAAAVPTTWFGRFIYGIQNFVEHDAFPFLENLFKTTLMDEVAALAPIATQALASIEGALPMLATGTEGFMKVFNQTVATTVQNAEAAGLSVGTHSIITAAQAALSNAQAAINTVAAPPAP
jgi:hypothetical protein